MTAPNTVPPNPPAIGQPCPACGQPVESRLVCLACGALLALNPTSPGGLDFFGWFGLPPAMALDTALLSDRWRRLGFRLHPDLHRGDSALGPALALRLSSAVNAAYKMLLDPAARGAYLLAELSRRAGFTPDPKALPEGFLRDMFNLQEQLEESGPAEQQHTRGGLNRQLQALRTERDRLLTEALETALPEAPALTRIQQLLNQEKYLVKLSAE
ncbi:MAG: hypothetical protein OEV94_09195 [Deltaproteobacteria bacterium]|nr:hypothetical protein [Deltaproteobacteria bacterium]